MVLCQMNRQALIMPHSIDRTDLTCYTALVTSRVAFYLTAIDILAVLRDAHASMLRCPDVSVSGRAFDD